MGWCPVISRAPSSVGIGRAWVRFILQQEEALPNSEDPISKMKILQPMIVNFPNDETL